MPMECSSTCILAIRIWSTGELAFRNLELISLMPEKYQLWLGGPRAEHTEDSDGSHRQRAQGRASGSGLSQEERVSAPRGAPHSKGRSSTD